MSLKTTVKNAIYDVTDDLLVGHAHKVEIAKFRDPKRTAILEQTDLTDDQKRAIDDFYVENYGKKIPYTWHRHNLAISGNFDARFFPELLFIPEFERYMNQPSEYATVFEDKNLLYLFADKADVRTTRSLLTRTAGIYRDANMKELTEREALDFAGSVGKCFAKPTIGTCSGQGCGAYDFDDGVDRGTGLEIKTLLDKLGADFSIQEPITCHRSISALHPESVNTLRVMTYRWRDELRVLPMLMRIGCGKSAVDNAHAGGVFIGVSDQGLLAPSALTEFNERFTKHPDTGVVFDGYRIFGAEKVIGAARRMHATMPQVGIVSWDFTVDEDGEPLVIEANIRGGSIWLPQMANGVPGFGDATADILRWLRFMNAKKPHERLNYKYGYHD